MELKGKCSKKFIRQGVPTIRDVHFDHECNFINSSYDKESGQVCSPNCTALHCRAECCPAPPCAKREGARGRSLVSA